MDGRTFFLMESETYGWAAACAVVDSRGRPVAADTYSGFDEHTVRQIRDTLRAGQKTGGSTDETCMPDPETVPAARSNPAFAPDTDRTDTPETGQPKRSSVRKRLREKQKRIHSLR